MNKNLYKGFLIFLTTVFIFTGCGQRELPVSKEEQLATGINTENSAVVIDTAVDVFNKPDVYSTRITQVIFNQVVTILSEEASWTKIAMLDGSEGWVRSKYINRDCTSVTGRGINNKIVITAKAVDVYIGTNNSVKYKQVVMGTELYSYEKTKTGYEVLLPENKRGWVEEGGVIAIPIDEKEIPKTTNIEFVQTANKLKGTTFLLGGISKWGVDSSGLVYMCSKINGVALPRDLIKMKDSGTKADIKNIQEGDLMFFSSDNLKKDISDIGIYIGNNEFIHASKTRGVISESLEESYYGDRVHDVRRIF